MLIAFLEATIANTRLRVSQGDCPILDPNSIEWMEDALITLADQRDALKAERDILRNNLDSVGASSELHFNLLTDDKMGRIYSGEIITTPKVEYIGGQTMISTEADFLGHTGGLTTGPAPDLGLYGEDSKTWRDCASKFPSLGNFQSFTGLVTAEEEDAEQLADEDAQALEFAKALMKQERPLPVLNPQDLLIETRPGFGIPVIATPYGTVSRELRAYRGEVIE